MPGHADWFNEVTWRQFLKLKPKRVFDVGIGWGQWAKFLKEKFPDIHIIGIEVFEPYITDEVKQYYDEIIINDVTKYEFQEKDRGDLIIFGDVLEHMELDEMMSLVKRASTFFQYMIVNTPYGYRPQGQEDTGNIHEVHLIGVYEGHFSDYNIIEKTIQHNMNLLIKNW